MASKLATLGGAALALLMVSSLPISAIARHGGGGGGHGGGFGGGHIGGFSGGHVGGGARMGGPGVGRAHVGGSFGFAPRAGRPAFHDRRFHHRRAFIGGPAYGYYDYGYGDGCYWLRRNALATGSPYWWSRYNACRYGY